MLSLLAHNQLEAHRFLQGYESAFTSRSDGSTWPKWERTWSHARRYFRGLLHPGSRKSITGLAKRMNSDQEQLKRFVRESPWEHQRVQSHLRDNAPAAVQGPARNYPAVPDDVDRETVEDIAARVEQTESWEPLEWNEGSKGPLSGLFYRERVRVVTNRQTGWVEDATSWLLFLSSAFLISVLSSSSERCRSTTARRVPM
jgi:hypothetical protein